MGQLCKEECSNTGPDIYSFIVYGLDFKADVEVPNSSNQIAHDRHDKLFLIFGKTFLLKEKLIFRIHSGNVCGIFEEEHRTLAHAALLHNRQSCLIGKLFPIEEAIFPLLDEQQNRVALVNP